MQVRLPGDIQGLREAVLNAANAAARHVQAAPERGIDLLRRIKFNQIGQHPTEGHPLNLVEQVNQTFTWLVALRALEVLHQRHPDVRQYEVNPDYGYAGTDVESVPAGIVAAEVFAAVDPNNNRKLAKDRQKVGRTNAQFKYVFFYSPKCGEGPHGQVDARGVQAWAVEV